ncbi:MAG TPA: hypothetical protein VGO11_13155 [Chthoniobacteraceae bacterium]|jgi:hypothetical protein|nr:hypothetical protein [Chthoniobacteraceae bacterium]
MNWLDRAEARFGHLAIHGLGRILVGFNLLVYVLYKLYPHTLEFLQLNPDLVRQGEVWRLVTFIFIPGFGGIFGELLGMLFYLLYLNFIAAGLEQAIGAFKLNVYYGTGMVAIMISSMFLGGASFAPFLLNSTLLFGFARFFPDTVIYAFFILPLKIKWLAWFEAALLLLGCVLYGWSYRVSLVVCMSNYLLFFGREHFMEAKARVEVTTRRQRFEAEVRPADGVTLHECAVCGITEAKDAYMDFRVARDGKEYCARHLPKAAPETA